MSSIEVGGWGGGGELGVGGVEVGCGVEAGIGEKERAGGETG